VSDRLAIDHRRSVQHRPYSEAAERGRSTALSTLSRHSVVQAELRKAAIRGRSAEWPATGWRTAPGSVDRGRDMPQCERAEVVNKFTTGAATPSSLERKARNPQNETRAAHL
jgi:hypothetical protein